MQQEGAKARQVLEHFLASHPEAADATLINILAELYIADEDWRAASKLIAETSDHLSAEGEVPIDLQVRVDTDHSPCSSKANIATTQNPDLCQQVFWSAARSCFGFWMQAVHNVMVHKPGSCICIQPFAFCIKCSACTAGRTTGVRHHPPCR
jgi:hypothetical protein